MRTDVKRRGWTISAEGNDLADRFLESVFFTGNGRMGAKAKRGSPQRISKIRLSFQRLV